MKERRISRKRRRQILLLRNVAIALAVILVIGIILIRVVFVNGRTLDVSAGYQVEVHNGAEELSEFRLASADGFAQTLVACGEEEHTNLISLSSDTEKALLFNIDEQEAVCATGIYERIYPASLTKIMTALLCVENGDLEQAVVMKDTDFELGEGAQVSQLDVGDTVKLGDLLNLVLVYSSNDASKAVARTIGGSEENFVNMMNQKAQSLGMTGTHFANPHGLHEEAHYTTLYDIYLMMNYAYKLPGFSEAASKDSTEIHVSPAAGNAYTFIANSTDEYFTGIYSLPQNVTVLASKTGTTDEAGSCLSLVVQNNYGVKYIAVVTGALNKDNLYTDMSALLNLINT
uniref:D-alanyl-D-alanine carboxypeptidase family protein n=1 Tax=Eubacterium cellulosolvens TaxID=29322 RepID=UPI0006874C76|nr:serine hydrolase [[Eubacterium] cellulosolvens]